MTHKCPWCGHDCNCEDGNHCEGAFPSLPLHPAVRKYALDRGMPIDVDEDARFEAWERGREMAE